jgi:hypothetical protein
MKRLALASVVLALLVGLDCESQAQWAKTDAPAYLMLRGLREVKIQVGVAGDVDLTKSSLESQALVLLKGNIPQLSIRDDAIPTVYVLVKGIRVRDTGGYDEYGYTFDIQLEISRPARILSDDMLGEVVTATVKVWDKGVLVVTPVSLGEVRASLHNLFTEFAADYYRANP